MAELSWQEAEAQLIELDDWIEEFLEWADREDSAAYDKAFVFMRGVRALAADLSFSIEMAHYVTSRQARALANWRAGVAAWRERRDP